jgi:hypothetical protein
MTVSAAVQMPVNIPARRLPDMSTSATIVSASIEYCSSCSPAQPTPITRTQPYAYGAANTGVAASAAEPIRKSAEAAIIAPRFSTRRETLFQPGMVTRIGPTRQTNSGVTTFGLCSV